MKKIILFLLLCTVSVVAYAQENEVNFTADRPGASTGPDVLDFKQVILETRDSVCRRRLGVAGDTD